MFTILWDNDGVLVDTEDLYFQATKTVLHTIGIDPTPDQYREISLRRGESMFNLAAEQDINPDQIAGLRAERDRLYTQLLGSQSWAIDGAEEVLRFFHGRMRMGVVTQPAEALDRLRSIIYHVAAKDHGIILQLTGKHRFQGCPIAPGKRK